MVWQAVTPAGAEAATVAFAARHGTRPRDAAPAFAPATAATLVGYAIADATGGNLQAAIDGFAAGALLVMLSDSMIPDARDKAGRVAGLVTVLGFAVAAALSSVSA